MAIPKNAPTLKRIALQSLQVVCVPVSSPDVSVGVPSLLFGCVWVGVSVGHVAELVLGVELCSHDLVVVNWSQWGRSGLSNDGSSNR